MTERQLARFLSKIEADRSGCWNWRAYVMPEGYGTFKFQSYDPRLAHRVAFEYWIGPIPDGFDIDHLCRNRRCVNPTHLEAVTRQVNLLRGMGPALNSARRLGLPGHPHTDESKARISARLTGRVVSAETRARMSESAKRRCQRLGPPCQGVAA